jgi:hypothetical protein
MKPDETERLRIRVENLEAYIATLEAELEPFRQAKRLSDTLLRGVAYLREHRTEIEALMSREENFK